jgi:hypothetical protein
LAFAVALVTLLAGLLIPAAAQRAAAATCGTWFAYSPPSA